MKSHYVWALVFISVIHSCSRIDMAANWADTYIVNQIDKYFDVSSLQSQFLKKAVKEDVGVIKKEVFPEAAMQFEKIKVMLEKNVPLTYEDLAKTENELKKVFLEALKVFEPNAQIFVKKLGPNQLEVFKATFDKKMKELESDAVDMNSAKKKRADKIKTQLQSWTGSLNKDQVHLIEIFANDNPPPIKESLLNRQKIAREFLDSFKSEESLKKFINTLFLDYESMREPSYVKAFEADHKKFLEFLLSIINNLTPEQRKHFIETLNDRIEQLRKVSQNKKGWLGLNEEENVRFGRTFYLKA